MNVHEALVDATQDVLNRYLAPELAHKLTAEIVERARRGIEEGLGEFFGFELGGRGGRGKPAKASRAEPPARRRREPGAELAAAVAAEPDAGAAGSRPEGDPEGEATAEGGEAADAALQQAS